MATKKVTASKAEAAAVDVKTPASERTDSNNLGELMHKLISPEELELQIRKGTPKKETIYMRAVTYLDRIIMDAHIEYVRRECEQIVDVQAQAQAMIATKMVDILYLSLHRKLKDGKLIRRFTSLEEAANFFVVSEISQLSQLYNKHFQLSNSEKKE